MNLKSKYTSNRSTHRSNYRVKNLKVIYTDKKGNKVDGIISRVGPKGIKLKNSIYLIKWENVISIKE